MCMGYMGVYAGGWVCARLFEYVYVCIGAYRCVCVYRHADIGVHMKMSVGVNVSAGVCRCVCGCVQCTKV